MAAQTYVGQRFDLIHYVGVSVANHVLTLVDQDCNEIDLDEFDEVVLRLLEKKHGTELFEINSVSSPAGIEFGTQGQIIFSIDYESMELKEKPYFYEVLGIVGNEKQLLSFGVYLIG